MKQSTKEELGWIGTVLAVIVFCIVVIMIAGCDNNPAGTPQAAGQSDNVPNNTYYHYRIIYTDLQDREYTVDGSGLEYFNEDKQDMIHIFQNGCGISIPQVSKNIKHFKVILY